MTTPLRLATVATVALFLLPASASAVEPTGEGANVAPVKNLPYADLHAPDERNAGTDLEFATLTVSSGEAAQALAAAPAAAPAPAASKPAAKKKAKKKKARRTPLSCRRAKSAKTRKARRRYAAMCRKAKRKAARKATLRDARPRAAGLQRTFSFAGSYGDGLHIIDVTDPANATEVATWDCGISQGDVQVFRREDLGGRTFVTFTQDDGYDFHKDAACAKDLTAMGFGQQIEEAEGAGTFIADVTDPYHPQTVSYVPVTAGSHNQTVHPSGRYLYNSNSDLITSLMPAIEIVDITDLRAPKPVGELALKTFPGLGTESHDVTFSADGTRAYSAALSHEEIIDTTNPAKPVSIGTIVDPTVNVFHQSDPIKVGDKTLLIIEDEVAGALGTGQCPNGGVHVYDITGDLERTPVPVGYWNIDDAGPTNDGLGTCTAHVFRLYPEQGLMTIAYYNGGVRVVDISQLEGVALGETGSGMKQLGYYRFPDSDTWSVKAPFASRDGFYMFGNDHRRGFDVYRYKPSGESVPAGRWLTPAQLRVAQRGVRPTLTAVCLLGNRGAASAARTAGLRIAD